MQESVFAGKKLGNAVVRNKVKRQVRSLIDEVFDFDEPWDFVLIVRPGYLKNDYAQLKMNFQMQEEKH